MRNATKSLLFALGSVLLSGAVSASSIPLIPGAEVNQTDDANKKRAFQVGMYRIINSLKMNVLVEKKLGDRVSVKLLDHKGHILFEDYLGVRQQKYGRKFDFSEVPDGNYSVVITNGNEQVVKDIHLSTYSLYEMPARTLVTVN